jgi:uncharacterized protein
MILTQEHNKNIITDYFKDKPVNKVWLFGSYAREDADEESDVDVVVDIDYSIPTGWGYYVWYKELGEKLNKDVDVVSKKFINHRLKPYIEKDMKLIYEK